MYIFFNFLFYLSLEGTDNIRSSEQILNDNEIPNLLKIALQSGYIRITSLFLRMTYYTPEYNVHGLRVNDLLTLLISVNIGSL